MRDNTIQYLYTRDMYIDTLPNRNSPSAVLLRESRREGGRTVKKTVANLSKYPPAAINAFLAEDRKRTRNELLAATEARLEKIAAQIARRTKKPMAADEIGVKVGKIINRHKVGKHFKLTIKDNLLRFERNEKSIQRETQLDGFYIVRTSEGPAELSDEDAVRTYKGLGQVELAFRCMKSVDLRVRPIRHRTEAHVRAHIFLCMLACYVEWHLRKALSPVLFQDDEFDLTDRYIRRHVMFVAGTAD
ncbi:transposase [Candidatus Hydrogenedentota bacterium]